MEGYQEMRDEWFLEMVHFQLLCTGYNEEWHDYINYYDNVCYRQLWAVVKELGTCMKRARIVSEGKRGLEKAERILKGKGREHGHSQIGKPGGKGREKCCCLLRAYFFLPRLWAVGLRRRSFNSILS